MDIIIIIISNYFQIIFQIHLLHFFVLVKAVQDFTR